MKTITQLSKIIITAVVLSGCNTANPADISKKEGTTIKEVSYHSERVSFLDHSFDVFVVNIKKNELSFLWRDNKGKIFSSFENINQYAKDKGKKLLFATNAGIFTPEYVPEGLFVENEVEKIPVNLKPGNGNFYMNFGGEDGSNGVFMVDKLGNAKIIKAYEYEKYNKNVKLATQSGPLLLYKGKINPGFDENSSNVKIRSGVGILNSEKLVFIISNEPVNFYNFAHIFRNKFNCSEALYLDGVISKMYLPELNRIDSGGNFAGMIGMMADLRN